MAVSDMDDPYEDHAAVKVCRSGQESKSFAFPLLENTGDRQQQTDLYNGIGSVCHMEGKTDVPPYRRRLLCGGCG